MPQVIVPPGFLKVDLHWTIAGPKGTAMNTFGVKYDTTADDETIDAALFDAFVPVAQNGAGTAALSFLTLHIGDVNPPYLSRDVVVNTGGTQGQPVMPPNVSLLIQKRTATPGRQGRGRTYLGGWLTESEVQDDATIAPTPLAGFQTMASNLADDLATDPLLGMHLLHLAGSSDVLPSFVTSYVVQPTVATQRRRLR